MISHEITRVNSCAFLVRVSSDDGRGTSNYNKQVIIMRMMRHLFYSFQDDIINACSYNYSSLRSLVTFMVSSRPSYDNLNICSPQQEEHCVQPTYARSICHLFSSLDNPYTSSRLF